MTQGRVWQPDPITALQYGPNVGAVMNSTIPRLGMRSANVGAGSTGPTPVVVPPSATPAGANYAGPLANVNIGGEPFAAILGGVLLLGLVKWLNESDYIPGDPGQIKVGGANLLLIGVTAAVFILALKIGARLVPIPGIYQAAMAL